MSVEKMVVCLSVRVVFAAGGVFFCRRWLCLCMLFCYNSEYSCAAYALNDDDDECIKLKYKYF